jgi:hypothetical protein
MAVMKQKYSVNCNVSCLFKILTLAQCEPIKRGIRHRGEQSEHAIENLGSHEIQTAHDNTPINIEIPTENTHYEETHIVNVNNENDDMPQITEHQPLDNSSNETEITTYDAEVDDIVKSEHGETEWPEQQHNPNPSSPESYEEQSSEMTSDTPSIERMSTPTTIVTGERVILTAQLRNAQYSRVTIVCLECAINISIAGDVGTCWHPGDNSGR